MKISAKGLELIKTFEGFEENAYPDPATGKAPWTIGYGTTVYPNGVSVREGDVCTPQQAEVWLWHYLNKIDPKLTVQLNQNQLDAIASFIYNLGFTAWFKSTLRRKININPKDATIPAEFLRWNKAAGKVMAGLTRRRKAEAELWNS